MTKKDELEQESEYQMIEIFLPGKSNWLGKLLGKIVGYILIKILWTVARAYNKVGNVFISQSGLVIAYYALRDNQTFIVVNGSEHGPYDALGEGPPVFSPDGQHLAYTVQRNGKWYSVTDDTEGKAYDSID